MRPGLGDAKLEIEGLRSMEHSLQLELNKSHEAIKALEAVKAEKEENDVKAARLGKPVRSQISAHIKSYEFFWRKICARMFLESSVLKKHREMLQR